MSLSIKLAEIKDAELISKLATETFFETYSWYNTPENMMEYTGKHFSAKQTRKEILFPNNWFFLARQGDEVIGYVKLRVEETPKELKEKKHIEIERIYVQQKHQNKKIGFLLLTKCIDFSRAKNFEVIWLGVWEKNEKALSFYERTGFTKFGTHAFLLGKDLQTDYLMKFDLI